MKNVLIWLGCFIGLHFRATILRGTEKNGYFEGTVKCDDCHKVFIDNFKTGGGVNF